jgi:cytochrome c oxidase accessory protein FixG
VFLEFLYRPIERLIEGTANERRALDKEGLASPRRLGLFVVKHLAFLAVSLALAHWFLAFFVPVPELSRLVISGPSSHPTLFAWAMVITGLLQFNFGWFREQICFIVCPYGRFQSVLVDQHSLVIGYDLERGEPRGKKLRVIQPLPQGTEPVLKGDCVDCGRCVRVCPTGIDIRNGIQMECIGCAQCIDACDDVMVRLGRDKGLVRYDSLVGFGGGKTKLARPRTLVYGAVAAVIVVAAVLNVVALRSPFEANLLRSAGIPYVLEPMSIRNSFELHLINKHPEEADFEIRVTVPSYATVLLPQPSVRLGTLESLRTPILVTAQRAGYRGPFDVKVELIDVSTGQIRTSTGRFMGPPGMGAKPGS